jgi:UMF1 family MFS transporter
MTTSAAPGSQMPRAHDGTKASRAGLFGWIIYDWAAQPYFTLITTFLFAPYFATAYISDPVKGQALWGYMAAVAGVLVALVSPLLGAMTDSMGRLKPWLAVISALFIVSMSLLWYAYPGGANLWLVLSALVIATLMGEFSIVLTNTLMTSLVSENQLGRLSGIAWAVGYVGGLISLLFMVGFIIPGETTGRTLLGIAPIISIDSATRMGDRLVGPFCAAWYLVFVLPLFLLTPDRKFSATPRGQGGIAAGFASFKQTLKLLPKHPDILKFLIARMLYTDALTAVFTFGGIYGVAVFGWQDVERGVFGIVTIIAGAIGAAFGGYLDDRIGSKPVIVISVLAVAVGTLGVLSIDATHVLFSIPVTPKSVGGGLFASTGEILYLMFATIIGLVAGPMMSASRTLMARMAPPDRMGQFFGLFAFSGKVTAFAAPLAIAAATTITGSQRLGVAVIFAFLVIGLLLMLSVNPRRQEF